MEDSGRLLLELFLMFGAGKLLAEFFERLRQPGVLGELVAGVLIGPSVLGLVHPNELTMGFAEMGAIFLLFTVGLETSPADLLEVGWTAMMVATIGVIVPFVLGFFYIRGTDHNSVEAIFVGAAMVATSVGITARVLSDLGVVATRAARVILAAAVLDDILGLLVLAVVSSISTGKIHYGQLAIVAIEAVSLALVMIFFASKVIGHFHHHVAKLRARNSAFILAVLMCLGLSLASVKTGMAAIVGAFLAGLALADHSEQWQLRENFHPLSEFLAPFFFVLLGVQVDVHSFTKPGLIGVATVICVLAIIGKLVGCGLGSIHLGFKDALRIGVGMVPRGEVGLIVAGVGLTLHTISQGIYAVVLLMSIVTTLIPPPFLRLLLPKPPFTPAIGSPTNEPPAPIEAVPASNK
jgi:Na+:H+ antiporter